MTGVVTTQDGDTVLAQLVFELGAQGSLGAGVTQPLRGVGEMVGPL